MLALALVGCGDAPGDPTSDTTGATADDDDGVDDDDGPDTTAGSADTRVDESSDGGTDETGDDPIDPPPVCNAAETGAVEGDELPEHYGFATVPPQMALADTFYTYDLRTNIGACSTDRVEWTLVEAPTGAVLEIDDGSALAAGESVQWEDGGAPREAVKLAWSLEHVEPGCHAIEVRWRAWRDCGALEDGAWGPLMSQRFEVAVRENQWYSGDLHVHTRHSERGDEAGGALDYYRRMVNETSNDSGLDFADRRSRSVRGRLHWLVFSEHTNNELEECGRNFAPWCANGEDAAVATGRDVVQAITEDDPSVLLVPGGEISNKFDGHFGFLPKNPFPGHDVYAPGYDADATDYDHDAGFGAGVFRERWVDEAATNDEEIALVHEMNALAIVNHENAVAPWVEYDWSSLEFDGLEVWNGGNRHDQDDDSAYHGGIDVNSIVEDDALESEMPEDEIERSWLGMVKQGRWPMVLVGGSDVHDSSEVVCEGGPCDPTNAELASPTTSVWAPSFVWTDGEHGVFDGLARGRVVVHDKSNFIDLRATYDDGERILGDTIAGYEPGATIHVRAFGRVADFVDGDNRVLLVLGTNGDGDDRRVDVLYSSEDATHFVEGLQGTDHVRYIRPDSSFDREVEITIDADRMGTRGTYFVWAQFVPWHNPLYAYGNGQDMALTGAIRITKD
jgi:hypothetical protein